MKRKFSILLLSALIMGLFAGSAFAASDLANANDFVYDSTGKMSKNYKLSGVTATKTLSIDQEINIVFQIERNDGSVVRSADYSGTKLTSGYGLNISSDMKKSQYLYLYGKPTKKGTVTLTPKVKSGDVSQSSIAVIKFDIDGVPATIMAKGETSDAQAGSGAAGAKGLHIQKDGKSVPVWVGEALPASADSPFVFTISGASYDLEAKDSSLPSGITLTKDSKEVRYISLHSMDKYYYLTGTIPLATQNKDKVIKFKIDANNIVKDKATKYYSFDVKAQPVITKKATKDIVWGKSDVVALKPASNVPVSWDLAEISTETSGVKNYLDSADLKKIGFEFSRTTGEITGSWVSQDKIENLLVFPDNSTTKSVQVKVKLVATRNIPDSSGTVVDSRETSTDVALTFTLAKPTIETSVSDVEAWSTSLSVDQELAEETYGIKAVGPGQITWTVTGLPDGVSASTPDISSNDRTAYAESWLFFSGTPTTLQKATKATITATNAVGSVKITPKFAVLMDASDFKFTEDTYDSVNEDDAAAKHRGFSGVFAVGQAVTEASKALDDYEGYFVNSADYMVAEAATARTFTVTAGPVKWKAENLPKGLSLKANSDGVSATLSGKFTKAQDFKTYKITATNKDNPEQSVSISGDIIVFETPTLKTTKIGNGKLKIGDELNFEFDAKDNDNALLWDITIGGVEAGEQYLADEDLSKTYLIVSGEKGIYGSLDIVPANAKVEVVVKASNPAGTATKTYTLAIEGKKPKFVGSDGTTEITTNNSSTYLTESFTPGSETTTLISVDGTLPITMTAYIDAATAKKYNLGTAKIDLSNENNTTGFVFEPNDTEATDSTAKVAKLTFKGSEYSVAYKDLPITIEATNAETGTSKPVKLLNGKYKVTVSGQEPEIYILLSNDTFVSPDKGSTYEDSLTVIAGKPIGYRDSELELLGDEGYKIAIKGDDPLDISVSPSSANGLKIAKTTNDDEDNYYAMYLISGTPTKDTATKTTFTVTAKNPITKGDYKVKFKITAQVPPTLTTKTATKEVTMLSALSGVKLKASGAKPIVWKVADEEDGDYSDTTTDNLTTYKITFSSSDASFTAAAGALTKPTLNDDGDAYEAKTFYVKATNVAGESAAAGTVKIGVKGAEPKMATKTITITRDSDDVSKLEISSDLSVYGHTDSVDVQYSVTTAEAKKLTAMGLELADESDNSVGKFNVNSTADLIATAAKGQAVKFTMTNYGTSNTGSVTFIINDPLTSDDVIWGSVETIEADTKKVDATVDITLLERSIPTGSTKHEWKIASKPSTKGLSAAIKANKDGSGATLTVTAAAKFNPNNNSTAVTDSVDVSVKNKNTGVTVHNVYNFTVRPYVADTSDEADDDELISEETADGEETADEDESEEELARGEGDVILGEARTEAALTAGERAAIEAQGYMIAAVLPEVTVTEDGLYDLDVAELVEATPEGAELVWFAFPRNAAASEDDEIAEFYDEAGAEIETVPAERKVVPAAWFNADVTYAPVIAVKVPATEEVKDTAEDAEAGDVVSVEALEAAE